MSMLIDHWRKLKGSVHPDDRAFFEGGRHTFNLDFPPPAFVGDIKGALVVVLMANGGFDPEMTPKEFKDEGSAARYLDRLHNPGAVDPLEISPYYDAGNYGDLIKSGDLALVNAVAYRSRKIGQEPENRALAKRLPSTQLHRRWLMDELLPAAEAGDRIVVFHRNALWGVTRNEFVHPNILYSGAPVSSRLAKSDLTKLHLEIARRSRVPRG